MPISAKNRDQPLDPIINSNKAHAMHRDGIAIRIHKLR